MDKVKKAVTKAVAKEVIRKNIPSDRLINASFNINLDVDDICKIMDKAIEVMSKYEDVK